MINLINHFLNVSCSLKLWNSQGPFLYFCLSVWVKLRLTRREQHFSSYLSMSTKLEKIVKVYKFAQSCPTFCGPMDCSMWGSSAHWIFQTRILVWGAIPFSRGSSRPKDRTHDSCVSYIGRQLFIISTTFCSMLNTFSHVLLFATLWTVAHGQDHMDLQSAPLDHMNHSQPYGP